MHHESRTQLSSCLYKSRVCFPCRESLFHLTLTATVWNCFHFGKPVVLSVFSLDLIGHVKTKTLITILLEYGCGYGRRCHLTARRFWVSFPVLGPLCVEFACFPHVLWGVCEGFFFYKYPCDQLVAYPGCHPAIAQ